MNLEACFLTEIVLKIEKVIRYLTMNSYTEMCFNRYLSSCIALMLN